MVPEMREPALGLEQYNEPLGFRYHWFNSNLAWLIPGLISSIGSARRPPLARCFHGSIVKWISHGSTKPIFQVRVLVGPPCFY